MQYMFQVNETELQVLEMVGESTFKQKLEVLEQQQELIEDESEQEEKEAQARREAQEAEIQRLEEEQKKAADKLDAFIPDQSKVSFIHHVQSMFLFLSF